MTTIGALEAAKGGMVRFAIDPSRGSLLDALVMTPTFRERLELGGKVGYTIMVLGAVTFVLAWAPPLRRILFAPFRIYPEYFLTLGASYLVVGAAWCAIIREAPQADEAAERDQEAGG